MAKEKICITRLKQFQMNGAKWSTSLVTLPSASTKKVLIEWRSMLGGVRWSQVKEIIRLNGNIDKDTF